MSFVLPPVLYLAGPWLSWQREIKMAQLSNARRSFTSEKAKLFALLALFLFIILIGLTAAFTTTKQSVEAVIASYSGNQTHACN